MRVFIFICVCLSVLACRDKSNSQGNNLPPVYTPNALEKWFEQNVLNRESVIQLALDSSGNNVTSQYDSTVFVLKKNTYRDGPFLATYRGKTDTGTWISNADYSKLTLSLKGRPAYALFNIDWKFKSKSASKLDMIPWFTFHGNRQLIIVPK